MLTEFYFMEEYSWELVRPFVIEQIINDLVWGKKVRYLFWFLLPRVRKSIYIKSLSK